MDHKQDVVCEKWLRFNENLGIVDTKEHHFHFKENCSKCLLEILCSGCEEEKRKACEARNNFEKLLE